MTQEELLLEIAKDPTVASNYLQLAFTLENPQDTVELPLGIPPVVMTKTQLFLETVQLDETQVLAYLALKNQLEDNETITLKDGRVMGKKGLILEALDKAPYEPLPYSALAFMTDTEEKVALPDGRIMNKNQLNLEALHLERHLVLMWFRDKYMLKPEDTVTLPDNRQLLREQLVAALVVDPNDCLAGAALVLTMKPGEKIVIPDSLTGGPGGEPPAGTEKTREEIALEAVKAAAGKTGAIYAFPFWVQTLIMNPGETVEPKLTGLDKTGHMGLLLKAMEKAPNNADYHLFAGLWLKPNEALTLPDDRELNQITFLQTALVLEPADPLGYIGLGYSIEAGDKIAVGGKSLSRQQLFLKAAQLAPELPIVYLCLALSLIPGNQNPITVNGQALTAIQLFEKYNQLNEK